MKARDGHRSAGDRRRIRGRQRHAPAQCAPERRALLAVTALTHLWWLYWLALVSSVLGLAMGTAGLIGLPFHPDLLIQPLT